MKIYSYNTVFNFLIILSFFFIYSFSGGTVCSSGLPATETTGEKEVTQKNISDDKKKSNVSSTSSLADTIKKITKFIFIVPIDFYCLDHFARLNHNPRPPTNCHVEKYA